MGRGPPSTPVPESDGARVTPPGAIAAEVAKLPERQRQIIEWRVEEYLLREISELDGGAHAATLSTDIRRTFEGIRDAVAVARRPL